MSKLAQSGIALLLITHHLPDVVPEIERVIFMRDGAIVADGDKEALLTDAHLSDLFGIPVRTSKSGAYYSATAE
jgi:iron complex transport system ATP-binding protein